MKNIPFVRSENKLISVIAEIVFFDHSRVNSIGANVQV